MLCLNIEAENTIYGKERGECSYARRTKGFASTDRGQFSSDYSSTTGSFLFGTEAVSIFFTNHHSVGHCNDYKSVG